MERKNKFHASKASDENIDDHNKSWNEEIHYQQPPFLKKDCSPEGVGFHGAPNGLHCNR